MSAYPTPAADGLIDAIDADLPAAAAGDRAAYSRIVAACQNSVTAIALAIVRDVPASEDIAQEAFLSAWQNLRRLQSPSSFLPWLRQITRNLARDHLRSQRRAPRGVDDVEAAIEAAADPQPNPCERLLDDERQNMAADLISALPDDSREVLLLYYREGQSSQQVASLLGLSDAAVRKRLSRARASVREEMLARFGRFAVDSAPSLAFTTMVATALTVASPPAAAAGLLTAGAAAGAKTFGQIVLGAAGSIGIAVVAAFAGIYLGLRKQLKGAIDDAERYALVRSAVICGLVSIAFVTALLLIAHSGGGGWWLPSLTTLGFIVVILWQTAVVQPRILRRRHALEAARDPVAAARRRRCERIQAWIGVVIGVGCGVGGLIAGLIQSGRL
ncbi:RNA polymerase sigma factor, sigma-70 family [Lysobacter sp. cf310]|nr:RNA polymerase sigma factor, sigma-70 family [Lysobacter sp. cf310]